MFNDEERKLIQAAAECIDEAITYDQDSFDSPPMPATDWDYNAGQLAYALRGLLASAAPAEGTVMLTDEQREAIAHAVTRLWEDREAANTVRVLRDILFEDVKAASAAPAEGREALAEAIEAMDVPDTNNCSNPELFERGFEYARSSAASLARAAVATAPTMSEVARPVALWQVRTCHNALWVDCSETLVEKYRGHPDFEFRALAEIERIDRAAAKGE